MLLVPFTGREAREAAHAEPAPLHPTYIATNIWRMLDASRAPSGECDWDPTDRLKSQQNSFAARNVRVSSAVYRRRVWDRFGPPAARRTGLSRTRSKGWGWLSALDIPGRPRPALIYSLTRLLPAWPEMPVEETSDLVVVLLGLGRGYVDHVLCV
jgi:hypothetical protein